MTTVRRHLRSGDAVHDVDVARHEGRLAGHVDGRAVVFDALPLRRLEGGAEIALVVDGGRSRAVVVRDGGTVHVHHRGRTWRFLAVTPRPGGDAADGANGDPFAASPMTGVVRKVLVRPGDRVAAGATLFVVEAMKMEFAVPAPRDVVVDEVRAEEGARVDIQQVLVTFRAGDGA
jgi:acetyl/propionyl-CoA carboxylase alpha subunit